MLISFRDTRKKRIGLSIVLNMSTILYSIEISTLFDYIECSKAEYRMSKSSGKGASNVIVNFSDRNEVVN